MAAKQKPKKLGKRKIIIANNKLATTENNKDFFLHIVSARTEVGNSKINIPKVKILDTNIISKRDSQAYL
jgi:hypothetical protein